MIGTKEGNCSVFRHTPPTRIEDACEVPDEVGLPRKSGDIRETRQVPSVINPRRIDTAGDSGAGQLRAQNAFSLKYRYSTRGMGWLAPLHGAHLGPHGRKAGSAGDRYWREPSHLALNLGMISASSLCEYGANTPHELLGGHLPKLPSKKQAFRRRRFGRWRGIKLPEGRADTPTGAQDTASRAVPIPES